MSRTAPHSASLRQRASSKNLNAPQMRAVRKELLLLRADVERAELLGARAELRQSLRPLGWLKLLVPGFARKGLKASEHGINATLSDLVARHPWVSSLASLLLAKPLKAVVFAGAKPVVKWGGLGLAAWTAYRLWAQIAPRRKGSRDGKAEDSRADPTA
jgi:hypothetical protein